MRRFKVEVAMSIHVLSRGMKNSRQRGGAYTVMMVMAELADETGLCWPSLNHVAERARMSQRNAIRAIARLRDEGEVSVVEKGRGRGNRNVYRIEVGLPDWTPKPSIKSDNTSPNEDAENLTNRTVKSDKSDRENLTNTTSLYREPPLEPSGTPSEEDMPSACLSKRVSTPSTRPTEGRKPGDEDDLQAALSAYHAAADRVGWPRVVKLTAERRSRLRQRLADAGGLEGWRAAVTRAENSPLCVGANERGWRADFDFLLQRQSFIRLIEGRYDARAPQAVRAAPTVDVAAAMAARRAKRGALA